MSTIADYNNNPGNIKPPKGITYEGQIGVDDRGFAIFENKDYGRKALVNDIEIKIKNGLNSPEAFINRYAPEGDENNEDARMNYKIHLAEQLGLKNTNENFPKDSAHKIADAIAQFESGNRAEPTTTTPAPPTTSPPNFGAPKLASSNTTTVENQTSPAVGTLVGGTMGTLAGTSAAVAKAKYDALSQAYDTIMNKTGNAPSSGETPGGKWGAKTGYGIGEGTVEEVDKRFKRAQPRGKISAKMAALWGIPKLGEDPQLAQRLIDRAIAQQQITQSGGRFSRAANYLGNLGTLPIKGGLMGATAGFGAADAYNRLKANEPEEATIGGLGTVASLVAPYVGSMGALPSIGIAAPLYLSAADRIRHLAKHPEEVKLQEDEFDPMGNPIR
jgi:hypothetical protein